MTDTSTQQPEGVWARLRRRKVVQWGIVYVAAAWGFLQGLEYVSEAFGWPTQLRQMTTLALLIGLPIVLVLAWYHGDRGQQRITTPEFAILTLLLLLGGGAFWYYQRTSETATVATPPTPTAVAAATDRSIAVLPFVNMSADKEQDYFADGISEELLNLLAQVPELRVIARTSSFSFKGKDVDIAEIARKLNVANVLEGSVRKSGDTLRITAQLVRASDSTHLWSQTYDRQMTEVFKVQDEIAAAVVDELKIRLLADSRKARATDPVAYELFLHARAIGRDYTPAAFERSIALYQQALTLDPAYAAAWEGLARTYCDQVFNGLRSADDGIRLAREASAKALTLDPEYAPAHARLGWIALYHDLDLVAAARHVERALALEPANPDILGDAALLARRLGRLDQAIAIGEHQIARDPANTLGRDNLGYAYRYAGRFEEAIAEYRTGLSLSPEYIAGHEGIGEVLLQKGDAEAALAEMQQEVLEGMRLVGLSLAHHALGRKVESDAALAELIQKYERGYSFNIAYVMAFRGEADRAFEWLHKSVQYHDAYLAAVAGHPMFANIHHDPRWLPFLRKLGMAPEQLAAIKFDVKVPK
jgi:TolB-like protein/tetratricopeptide (TPR) repeat protein